MKYNLFFIRWMLLLTAFVSASSCTEDQTQDSDKQYGYIQFHLSKNSTRVEQLDYLHEVCKIRVDLTNDGGNVMSQTLTVSAFDNQTAELGMQSEKWMLLSGKYRMVGYELFDQLEKPLMLHTYPTSNQPEIQVNPLGIALHEVSVNVMGRGTASFRLTKDNAKATRAEGVKKYPFHMIMAASVRVKNLDTNVETLIEKLKVKYKHMPDPENPEHISGVCVSDSLVSLPAGRYRVIGFDTFFDKTNSLLLAEHSTDVIDNEFTVVDNHNVRADVPVTLDEAAAYIKDAYALREIWVALDGPNWAYRGRTYPKGTNWTFENRDVDLWLAQPGVQILETGRVAALNLDGFGANGHMPAALGQLTELRDLYLGSHNSELSDSAPDPTPVSASLNNRTTIEQIDREIELRGKSFAETFIYNGHPLERFSEEMQIGFEFNNIHYEKTAKPLQKLPINSPVNYVTYVKSLPAEIGNLKKLKSLYIAMSPIRDLPTELAQCIGLTDLELFCCHDLEVFPSVLAELPGLSLLVFSTNRKVSSDAMITGLKNMNTKAATLPNGSRLQVLQVPGQPFDYLPDLTNLKRLGSLSMQQCKIKYIEKAFGKEHPFVSIAAGDNEISELPVDEFGYFIELTVELELLDFSYNKFTELPNIFNAKSIYKTGTMEFSHNQISKFQGEDDGTWRGMNTNILSLGYNNLTEFPEALYSEDESCSRISFLQLQGNAMETISEEALKGTYTSYITSLDLSYNRLKKLPISFNAETFPYLYGIDLSFNRFDRFETRPLNSASLTTFIFRGQRDEDGNRCMKEWLSGIGSHKGLRALFLGSNDIRKVIDPNLSYLIFNLEIRDNPNISIDITKLCPAITARQFRLSYDLDQDIRGCDALKLNN